MIIIIYVVVCYNSKYISVDSVHIDKESAITAFNHQHSLLDNYGKIYKIYEAEFEIPPLEGVWGFL